MLKRLICAFAMALWAVPAVAQLPPASGLTVGITPIQSGTNGLCLYQTGGKLGEQACGTGTAATIAVGTTTVTGGTDTYILFNNAGVLGNKQPTGSGLAVLQTSPTLITPALGAATATTIAIGGAAIGSNALAVTGQGTFSGNVVASKVQATASSFLTTLGPRLVASSSTVWNATLSDEATPTIFTASQFRAGPATAIPSGGSNAFGFVGTATANFGIFFGSGAPSLSAAKGSLYLRSDGSTTNDRIYVNTNGTTGWTNLTSGS